MSGNNYYQPMPKSVFIVSLWCSCVLMLPVFLFFMGDFLILILSFIAFYLISFSLFYLRRINCLVHIKDNEIYIQQGAIFKFTFRFPRRYITGVTIFKTPLLKLFDMCIVFIFSSGNGAILFGFSSKDGLDIEKKLLNREA